LNLFVTKVHEINVKKESECMRENRVLTSPQSAHQWFINFILAIHSMHVMNKQENTLLKDVNNSSLVGTDRPPNY
jgi:hypothetical protein